MNNYTNINNNSLLDLVYQNNGGGSSNQSSDIINDSNVSGSTVTDALNALLSGMGGISIKREIFTSTNNQKIFTLASIPVQNSEIIDVNGLKAYPGINYDYTISGNVVTFTEGLPVNYKIMVTYF